MLVQDYLIHSAAAYGEKIAVVYGGERVPYSRLLTCAGQVAARLTEQDLTPGERVAILTDERVHYIASYFGILQAGGIIVGLNTQTSERSLNTVLSDCGASQVLISGRCRTYGKYIRSHPGVRALTDIETLLADSSYRLV
ncbi:MAG: acyl--CoA ligase, partial [Deltaproteobacteria bacterium]|nr:acyl--CoA ligase [Deltaproteobacteria bacterium]